MTAKVALFILYALDAFVYAYKKLSGSDLYEGRGYYYFIFAVSALFLPFLVREASTLRSRSRVRSPKSRDHLRLLIGFIVLSVTLSYLANGFVLASWFNDSLTYTVYALIGYILFMRARENPLVEYRSLKKIFAVLLCVHVIGIVILTCFKYDAYFVIRKVFVTQFSDVEGNYEDSKLYFFGLAGNEEAYSTLIALLVAVGSWSFWKQMFGWPIGFIYFLFLGTRTVFLLYCFFGMFLIWKQIRGRTYRLTFVGLICVGLIALSDQIVAFLQRTFSVFSAGKISIADLTTFYETDTLGFRVITQWGTILSNIVTPARILFGLSRPGLSQVSDPGAVSLTATHNAFIYFYATLGVLGLCVYSLGYYLMLKSFSRLKRENPAHTGLRTNYGMVIATMMIYALMNNAHGIQGVLIYLLIIAFGLTLAKTNNFENAASRISAEWRSDTDITIS
jgi:hypothetical protein